MEMKIHKNIGDIDRIIRIFVFIIFIYLGYRISPWIYLLAVFEAFAITTRWCFVYDILKITTINNKIEKIK
jgi:hypothetical protein